MIRAYSCCQPIHRSSLPLYRAYSSSKQDDPFLDITGPNSEASADSRSNSGSNPVREVVLVAKNETDRNGTGKIHPLSPTLDGKPQISSSPLPTQTIETKKRRTIAEMDEELRLRMSGRLDEGGEAGIEYEDGKPVALKRAVRDNMFRLI